MINVRAYAAEDYNALMALYKNKRAYGGNFDPARDENDRLMATSEKGNLYVAVQNDSLVGSFMILDNPHSFWLLRFAVNPTLADVPEVSAALFERARKIARERNHSSVIVYTDSQDQTLKQRYEKLGCHQADVYQCYWKETV